MGGMAAVCDKCKQKAGKKIDALTKEFLDELKKLEAKVEQLEQRVTAGGL